MVKPVEFLKCGSCETFKASVHATALGLAAVMGIYNAAAWLSRREQHLAINAILYAALTAWEQKHVAHHLAELRLRAALPCGLAVSPDTPTDLAA